MMSINELKDKLKRRIDNLPEDKLNAVSKFLESLDIEINKEKLLSFAGSWNDIDDDTFNELTKEFK